ncbi:MAG: hypothetical protein EXS37_16565 [Opitutus sp.]|nr:hypothetical protein [Opitutus sp.]
MAANSSDKVLIAFALLAALASAGAFGTLAMRQGSAPSGPPPRVELASTPYTATAPDAPPIKTETWGLPVAQTRGRDWIYDTFTPPEIFYNARSKQFTVKPPSSLMDEEQLESFGLELVAVRPEPFRLQLIGYAGEDNAKGLFQNVLSGQVYLAAAGRRFPELGLAIKSFEVAQQTIRSGESMATKQRVATAVMRDEKSNRDVTLTHRDRVFTGTVFAFVAATGESAAREVRTGDTFKLGEATYRIDKILTSPASVEVTKEAPSLAQPDRRILTPREADETERPDGSSGS